MSLKQSIIVVNEFSTPQGKGKGSRGATPGNYVLRYMARQSATEGVTPIRLDDNDVFVTRYMARRQATEKFSSIGRVKEGMKEAQGLGGVAFGSFGKNDEGDVSLSDRKVRRLSKSIQKEFEKGKTVMKTVISFKLEYLKKMGIVESDFVPKNKGDYRGHVDQLKLRLAIMNGMKKMAKHYDDLSYAAVIQVDTMHVHCHLCIVDKGRGNVMPNGEQRGKITAEDRKTLRHTIDLSLDEMHPIKMFASSVAFDRRNARCFIKKFTHETMKANGTPQFLLACLPKDKTLWRASTNRVEMQKANAITREYVEQVLAKPNSGYAEAMRAIGKYADERVNREGLSTKEHRQLIANGRERLVNDCMNGVYQVLKNVPEDMKTTRTAMIDAMSMEYTQMAAEAAKEDSDPLLEFGFKLRSYSSRLRHHSAERHKYHDAAKEYEDAQDKGEVSEDSKPLYDFYKIEEEYQAMLVAKYRHFLNFLPPEDEYQDDFDELMKYRDKLFDLNAMKNDEGMKKRSAESAEDYGRRVYGMHGGRFMVINPSVLDQRMHGMIKTYTRMTDDFEVKLEDGGMHFESDEHRARVVKQVGYDFDSVKALDLHHLGYDFPYDTPISKTNVDIFTKAAFKREKAYLGARRYLIDSKQEDALDMLPQQDIRLMSDMAKRLSEKPLLLSSSKDTGGRANSGRTVSLDTSFQKDMELAVQATVQSAQFAE